MVGDFGEGYIGNSSNYKIEEKCIGTPAYMSFEMFIEYEFYKTKGWNA